MKMLIIDDDPVSRTVLLDILGSEPDVESHEAGNGLEALAKLRSGFKPDLCLLDLQMPNMGGLELLQRMRSHADYKNVPVVVTSSTRDRNAIEAIAKLQIAGYLLKPFDRVKTLTTVQKALLNPSAAKPQTSPRKFSLLAVDDDPAVRTAIAEHVLRTEDWHLHLAVNGDEASELLYAGLRPHLIVTAIDMPTSDGLAFIGRLRRDRNYAALHVAVLIGNIRREHVTQLAALKVVSWLQKPVSRDGMDTLLNETRGKREAVPDAMPIIVLAG